MWGNNDTVPSIFQNQQEVIDHIEATAQTFFRDDQVNKELFLWL